MRFLKLRSRIRQKKKRRARSRRLGIEQLGPRVVLSGDGLTLTPQTLVFITEGYLTSDNEAAGWMDDMQRQITDLMRQQGERNFDIRLVNWHSYSKSTDSEAAWVANWIDAHLEQAPPGTYDILLIGFGRGAVFNADVINLVRNTQKLDHVEMIQLDPTASQNTNHHDTYPRLANPVVTRVRQYTDLRHLSGALDSHFDTNGRVSWYAEPNGSLQHVDLYDIRKYLDRWIVGKGKDPTKPWTSHQGLPYWYMDDESWSPLGIPRAAYDVLSFWRSKDLLNYSEDGLAIQFKDNKPSRQPGPGERYAASYTISYYREMELPCYPSGSTCGELYGIAKTHAEMLAKVARLKNWAASQPDGEWKIVVIEVIRDLDIVSTSVPTRGVFRGVVSTDTSTAQTSADHIPPAIGTIPDDIIVEATSGSGTRVSYALPSAVDSRDGDVPVTCSHTSGSIFPLGTTSVSCSVADNAGNRNTGSFNVIVRDTTPPAFVNLPPDIQFRTKDPSGIAVSFEVPLAVDKVNPKPSASCSHENGAMFPVGKTTVSCTVTDQTGNSASTAFLVDVVLAPPNDVNNDGFVTPLDVLLVIARINRDGAAPINGIDQDYDVNGDGLLTPQDVLVIINEININAVASVHGEEVPENGYVVRDDSTILPSNVANEPTPSSPPRVSVGSIAETQKQSSIHSDAVVAALFEQSGRLELNDEDEAVLDILARDVAGISE